MARRDGEGDSDRILLRGGRAPLVVTLLVVAAVAGAYYAYYRGQVGYYTGRNLRLLSMLTAQMEGRVDMFAGFVRTQTKAHAQAGMDFVNCMPASSGAGQRDMEVQRGVEEGGRGWRLRLQAPASSAAKEAPAMKCATVSLDDVLHPIFARRLGSAFDMLLVASADGTVLYSIRPPQASATLLRQDEESNNEAVQASAVAAAKAATPRRGEKGGAPPASETSSTAGSSATTSGAVTDRQSGSTFLITKLGALSKRTGWRNYERLDVSTLTSATDHFPIAIDGAEYVLFSQPYTFARAAASLDGKPRQWIVCGLVSASRFRYEVSAVSTSVILIAIAVVLLAICCWPFLRIALIDQSQALTIADVVLVVICTIVGASVLTLALLDVFAYQAIGRSADEQLERFSEGVNHDFGDNVTRAMDVLARMETLTSKQSTRPETVAFPADVLGDRVVGSYPYIDSIAWIDAAGVQQLKLARDDRPLLRVRTRQYFKDALADRTWTVQGHPYVLEWVRSMSTGDVLAVLAKKTTNAARPVIALATELVDVTHAVRPPGVEMAIINEDGEVVYHSDTQRIGYENFFAEADQDRELRSAVVARRAGHVTASYWGDDKSMYVRPLTGSPWTLVMFRAKRLTRVLNVEGVLLALLMLLLSATPYLILFIIVLIMAPGYRAPRLWPDASRWGDYLRLTIILIPLLMLYALNNYILTPWSSFFGILILPAISMMTTFLVLHRRRDAKRFAIVAALWIIVYAVLISSMIVGDVDSELWFSSDPAAAKTALVLITLAVAALTVLLLFDWNGGARAAKLTGMLRSRIGYSGLYRLCGVLMLAVGVAMPVVGFFTISRQVESELLLKYAQLRAAADLEHRIDHLETMNVLPKNSPAVSADLRSDRFADVFGSRWSLVPPLAVSDGMSPGNAEPAPCARREGDWTIPPSAAFWLPALYEDSIAIRPLFEAGSADDLWHWCLKGRLVKLVRKIRFDPDVANLLWGSSPPMQQIVIESRLPQAAFGASSDLERDVSAHHAAPAGAQRLAILVLIAVPLVAVFWYAANFVATRVLLIDVREPNWLARLPLSPTLGDHIFLVRRDKDANALTGPDPMGKGLPFLDVSFREMQESGDWSAALESLDSSAAGRNVRIIDFEYRMNDPAMNEQKLQWLERLLALPDRTVIVVSAVSATYIMTTSAPPGAAVPGYFERWRTLLDRFVWVTAEDLELRHDEWRRQTESPASSAHADAPRSWLAKETQYNSFLRRLRAELDPTADRKHLLDEISEKAETYYAGLWASCREQEKLLLYQLAHTGLANGRNRRVLRRLMARGLVRRDPNLQLFSETFRIYVLEAAQKENLVTRAREQRRASTWDSLRLPFFVIIISFMLLLFATQKDLLTTTTAFAAALTTGLPILMKLIGIFTERRLQVPDKA